MDCNLVTVSNFSTLCVNSKILPTDSLNLFASKSNIFSLVIDTLFKFVLIQKYLNLSHYEHLLEFSFHQLHLYFDQLHLYFDYFQYWLHHD